jgi:hypothetical protein
MFQSVTNGRKVMLRQKLASLKMEPGEKAAKYIARAKDLKRDLIQADLEAKEVDLAAACGLSKNYKEIRMMLEYQEQPIDLDSMLPLLLQHEARIEQDEEDGVEKQNSMAFASRSYKHGSGTSKKGSGCFTRGENGQTSYECEKNPHKNVKCHNCERKGHIKKDCRALKKESGESSGSGGGNCYKKTMAFTTFQGKDLSKIWLLNSGATHHLSGNMECFSELREVEGDVLVEGVGSEKLRVEGIGKVPLYCETGGGIVEIILKEVKYTPSADVNLASLSKLLNKGVVLHGEGKVLELHIQGETFLRAENW